MSCTNTRVILSCPWVYFERMVYDERMRSSLHRHGAWHFSASVEKDFVFSIQNKEYVVSSGTWILFSPEMLHYVEIREPGTTVLQLFFDYLPQNTLPEVANLINFKRDLILQGKFSLTTLKYLEDLFRTQMQLRCFFQKSWGQILPQLFLQEALSGIDTEKIDSPVVVPEFLMDTLNYMEKHYSEMLSLSDFAEMTHLSPSRFNSVFRKLTGISPLQYLQRIRLRQAQNMLLSGVSIRETAQKCGFSTVQYFYHFFKQKTRQTPAQFLMQPFHAYVSEVDTSRKEKTE